MIPADRQWGRVLDNGTVTGMVGLVARHEANMAANDITLSGNSGLYTLLRHI